MAMVDLASAHEWMLLVLAPFVGSFLGVLITRLPEGEPVVLSRSHCSHCRRILGVRDLIPVLSWLVAQRRCRYCGSPLGWFYPNIEVAALAVALWASTVVSGPLLWVTCVLGWLLMTLAVIDIRHMILPNALTPAAAGNRTGGGCLAGQGGRRGARCRRHRWICRLLDDRNHLPDAAWTRGTWTW
ncbi:MAG: prepilin peptidase [Rhodospirillales bacterium]|nr:prepilin peptidase [Rhodospirillales bacterium]